MSELNRSVVVCNLDGRILLYNNRARLQFKRLSQAAQATGGSELIGLGRSIYTVLDRNWSPTRWKRPVAWLVARPVRRPSLSLPRLPANCCGCR
jgi:hypothetical protein